MTVSFVTDIKPLFTAMDRNHMLNLVGMFDLWNIDDVKSKASIIYQSIKDARMPPPDSGEERWPANQLDLFKAWMDGGFQP